MLWLKCWVGLTKVWKANIIFERGCRKCCCYFFVLVTNKKITWGGWLVWILEEKFCEPAIIIGRDHKAQGCHFGHKIVMFQIIVIKLSPGGTVGIYYNPFEGKPIWFCFGLVLVWFFTIFTLLGTFDRRVVNVLLSFHTFLCKSIVYKTPQAHSRRWTKFGLVLDQFPTVLDPFNNVITFWK